MQTKSLWKSKTVWVNLIAGASMLVEAFTGAGLSLEVQGAILVIANLILRRLTKTGIR